MWRLKIKRIPRVTHSAKNGWELEDSIEGDPFLLYLNACNNGISDSVFVMSAMVENKSK